MKRETRGRPRLIIGPDRQAVRFAFDTTPDDVEEMVGPGTYRVYALNEVGTLIDYVTTIVVGADQEDHGDIPTSSAIATTAIRGPGSDLRFALETIRDTNRVLADSLKAVAASQADWVKGLAVAKSLPRNAPSWYLQPPPRDDDDDDDDDGGETDGATPVPDLATVNAQIQASTLGSMAKIADAFTAGVQTVKDIRNLVTGLKQPPAPPVEPPRNAAPPATAEPPTAAPNPMIHLAEINARLTKEERRFLSEVLRGEDGQGVTEQLLALSVDEAVVRVRLAIRRLRPNRRSAAPPPVPSDQAPAEAPSPVVIPPEVTEHGAKDFMGHVIAASAFLTAEERAAVLWLFPKFPADRLEQLKVQLLRMTPEEAAAWVKANLEALRDEVSS
jgi:hypothetical protein